MLNTRMVPDRWVSWLLALALLAGAGAQARAWEVRESLVVEKEYLLKNPAYDILVATVLAVDGTGATNANPPKVRLRVKEVLRGDDREDTIAAAWQAPVFHEDTKEGGGTTEAWQARPLTGPTVGAELIVFSIGPPESLGILAWSVYRFTPQNRAGILEHAATERSASIQIPVLVLILAIPLAMVILFVRSLSAAVPEEKRRRLRRIDSVLAVLTLGLYVFYETGISVYSNIRIDLLVILPAVGGALILGALCLFRWPFRLITATQARPAAGSLWAILGKALVWGIGTALVVTAVAFVAPVMVDELENDVGLLIAIVVARPGLIVGFFLALLFQVRRVPALAVWGKIAYGSILLLLFFPFLSSVTSVSSHMIGMSASVPSDREQSR